MAYTVDILKSKQEGAAGLLSQINIGGQLYDVKDLIARENIGTLSAGLDAIAADLAAKHEALTKEDAAIRDYVDAQVGAINKFDVHVMQAGEALPDASAETMYVLYLKPETDAASGAYVEYITVKDGEVYKWEAIGSTKMDVTGFVTEEALADALADYTKTENLGDLATKNEADLDLKALAHKDNATGTVASQTISGVKATGNAAGSINVTLEATEKEIESAGKYTPAGGVTGTVTIPEHNVPIALAGNDVAATIATGTGSAQAVVSFTPASSNVVTSATQGTQASFKEGAFTAATLGYEAVEANYATEGIVGSVADECLTFTAAGIAAITATKVNSFDGGSKAADTFVANSLPTMAEQNVGVQSASFTGTKAAEALVTGVSYDKAALENLTFAGTKAEQLVVTGVSYQKADIDAATFTGKTVDIAATFAGTEGDVSVTGKCNDYAVKTAEFVPAAIEVAVGDIVVAEKTVTVQ